MMQYHTLATDEDDIQLTVEVDRKGKYFMPYLVFKDESGNDTKDDIWDNDKYIFEEFFPFLKRYKNKSLNINDKSNFSDIWEMLEDGNLVNQLIEMIEAALKQKWYAKTI